MLLTIAGIQVVFKYSAPSLQRPIGYYLLVQK